MKRMLFLLALALAAALPARAADYHLYTGGTHSHTSFSDGSLLPENAWDTARLQGHTDFWFVTEHYQSLYYVENAPAGQAPEKEWDYELRVGREKTEEGKFLALVGWEWSDSETGHMNMLFDASEPPPLLMTATYETLISNWLKKRPDAVTGFNHPLWSEVDANLDNFHDFAYNPRLARQVVYMEVSFLDEVRYFYRGLDKGWWLAPLAAQDNHSPDWGLIPEFCKIYATELTEPALKEAFLARRFYATTDRAIDLSLNGNGEPMGSRLSADKVSLDIAVTNTAGKTPRLVRLVTSNAVTLKEWTPDSAAFTARFEKAVAPGAALEWFVVYVENADGTFALSAPIIVKNPAP